MEEYKDLKYEIDEENQWILMTSSAACLDKVIMGVAAENGLRFVTDPAVGVMRDYGQNPSRYPSGIERGQVDVGRFHRMAIQTDDDGDFFEPGDIMLQYLYNDAGESEEARAAHFEEIKSTFRTVLEKI